jgi:carbonic anhydrase
MPSTSAAPRQRLAIVTCMDARIDPVETFGLTIGDAHVIRNAGAIVSDDVLRSLLLSQRLLWTRSVRIVAHTSCWLLHLNEEQVVAELRAEAGQHLPFGLGAFSDLDDHVRQHMTVSTVKKSHATMPAACERRNVAHDSELLPGAGSIRAFLRMVQMVDAAMVMPSRAS